MALVDQGHGTQTVVIGTEHLLVQVTTAKTCCLAVDTVNMAAGDNIELRASIKVLTGSTYHVAYLGIFSGAQSADDLVKISTPVSGLYALKFSLKQTAGLVRNYDWSVYSID